MHARSWATTNKLDFKIFLSKQTIRTKKVKIKIKKINKKHVYYFNYSSITIHNAYSHQCKIFECFEFACIFALGKLFIKFYLKENKFMLRLKF